MSSADADHAQPTPDAGPGIGPGPLAPGALEVVVTNGFGDYELIDSGVGRKLERFGGVIVDRPEVQALWQRRRPAEWQRAAAVFAAAGEDEEKGRWRLDRPVSEPWPVRCGPATMLCRLQGLWHLGLFPEQLPHWQWIEARIRPLQVDAGSQPVRLLNLFGYTGAATLFAAAAGAHVTHVDASRRAVAWGRENQVASGLADRPVRWIVDDAAKFAAREVRRGRRYDIIVLDPPKFGRGPDGEVWDLFLGLPGLLADCARLLEGRGALILTVYAIRASALAFGALAAETLAGRGGDLSAGELAIAEAGTGGRLLPTSLFVRWSGKGA